MNDEICHYVEYFFEDLEKFGESDTTIGIDKPDPCSVINVQEAKGFCMFMEERKNLDTKFPSYKRTFLGQYFFDERGNVNTIEAFRIKESVKEVNRELLYKAVANIVYITQKRKLELQITDETIKIGNKGSYFWGEEDYKTISLVENKEVIVSHKALSKKNLGEPNHNYMRKVYDNLDLYAPVDEMLESLLVLTNENPIIIKIIEEIGVNFSKSMTKKEINNQIKIK